MVASVGYLEKKEVFILDHLLEYDRSWIGAVAILFSISVDLLVCGNYFPCCSSRFTLDRPEQPNLSPPDAGCIVSTPWSQAYEHRKQLKYKAQVFDSN